MTIRLKDGRVLDNAVVLISAIDFLFIVWCGSYYFVELSQVSSLVDGE